MMMGTNQPGHIAKVLKSAKRKGSKNLESVFLTNGWAWASDGNYLLASKREEDLLALRGAIDAGSRAGHRAPCNDFSAMFPAWDASPGPENLVPSMPKAPAGLDRVGIVWRRENAAAGVSVFRAHVFAQKTHADDLAREGEILAVTLARDLWDAAIGWCEAGARVVITAADEAVVVTSADGARRAVVMPVRTW